MKIEKNSYQIPNINRLLKTFQLERADRIPNLEFMIDGKIASAILNKKVEATLGMEEPKDHLELARRIGMDAIGLGIFYSPGRVWEMSNDEKKHYIDGSIKSWNDLKKISPLKLESFSENFRKLERYLEATKDTGVGTWVYIHGPFDPVYLAMGLTDFCLKIYDDFKFVEYLMDFILEVNCEILKEMVKFQPSFIQIADDVGMKTGLIIKPELFKRMYIPRLKKLIEPAKKADIPLTFHSDGCIKEIIPELIELGFCALNPIEPYSNDIYQIKKEFGDKICLIGNIELTGKTAQQVKEDTKKHIELLGGGYVVSSSHSVTDDTPLENFLAMVETTHHCRRHY